jgi:hypothetical protein
MCQKESINAIVGSKKIFVIFFGCVIYQCHNVIKYHIIATECYKMKLEKDFFLLKCFFSLK